MTGEKRTFVFGSNLAGIHGAGAARFAHNYYGAEFGVGVGRTGNSYAIPTKDENILTLPLETIKEYVKGFITYAKENPELRFQITAIDCGLAGYTPEDIAPMFYDIPGNCDLPPEWDEYYSKQV